MQTWYECAATWNRQQRKRQTKGNEQQTDCEAYEKDTIPPQTGSRWQQPLVAATAERKGLRLELWLESQRELQTVVVRAARMAWLLAHNLERPKVMQGEQARAPLSESQPAVCCVELWWWQSRFNGEK